MTGVEIDFVVPDSIAAMKFYERIFDIKSEEMTDFEKGQNEAVFSLYDVRFHMLDENPDFQLIAPKPDDPKPIWFNIMVPDIEETFKKALDAGCNEIQPVTEMEALGLSNGIFRDPYGYIWMLHQIHRKISPEERRKIWEERK